ncbi:MAG: permease-like cell division protein FtsX [Deltaproteobacteria bacterium]|jgi:cell division transport system permease protein
MLLRSGFYFFRRALQNVRDNRFVYFLGLGTISACLLILGAFLLLFVNINSWFQGWGHTLSLNIYLEDGISNYQKDKIYGAIQALPGAQIRRFISKKEAMADLERALGDKSKFLDHLSHNPLPASYEVIFEEKDESSLTPQRIKEKLEKMDGVDEVQCSEEWRNKIEGVLGVAKFIGLTIGGLLCLCVVFIVTNTVKLTLYSRRDEIEILKLVGATDWFVKLPFLLEGVIQGLLGGVVSLVLLFGGYLFLASKKLQILGLAPLDFVFISPGYMAVILLVGVVMSALGSLIAVGRFFDI